jgi:dipeptidyl aminopeptidase/acylaminoacyl peptidase
VIMRKIFGIFTLIALTLMFISCAGSRKDTGTVVTFADKEVQEEVNRLKGKIEENPNNMEYRRQLAEIYSHNGEGFEAMHVLEQSFQIDPNDSESKYLYAEIAMSVGEKLKAFQAYKDVLQGSSGEDYLSRIGPKFTDAFEVTKIVSSPANEAFGRFSKSGDKIIYQSDQKGNWDIFEYNITAQITNQLTNSPYHEENPDYSPNGNVIVFTSTVEDHRDVDYDQKLRDIFIKDLKTGRETNLTTNGSNDWRPSYSSDGKYITFISERSDLRDVPFYELHGDIFIMENDGRFQLQITKDMGNCGGPSIAPGSTEATGTVYFDSYKTGNYEIYKTNFKGENTRQITFYPASQDVSPCISPSGDKIVFFSDRDDNYEIYMMNSDGSAAQRLTANPADDLNPVFSPDGSKVLFHSNRDGNYDLFMIDLTQQAKQLYLYEVVAKIDGAINLIQTSE